MRTNRFIFFLFEVSFDKWFASLLIILYRPCPSEQRGRVESHLHLGQRDATLQRSGPHATSDPGLWPIPAPPEAQPPQRTAQSHRRSQGWRPSKNHAVLRCRKTRLARRQREGLPASDCVRKASRGATMHVRLGAEPQVHSAPRGDSLTEEQGWESILAVAGDRQHFPPGATRPRGPGRHGWSCHSVLLFTRPQSFSNFIPGRKKVILRQEKPVGKHAQQCWLHRFRRSGLSSLARVSSGKRSAVSARRAPTSRPERHGRSRQPRSPPAARISSPRPRPGKQHSGRF